MEVYNGWARPLDSQVQKHGYQLYNVNNLKLARFKEIFPAPAKSDSIDAHKILELFQLQDHLPLAKGVLQAVLTVPQVNQRLKRLTRRRRQLSNERLPCKTVYSPIYKRFARVSWICWAYLLNLKLIYAKSDS